MKVRYSVTEILRYSGTLEISKDSYEIVKDGDTDSLGNYILDHIDRRNPSDVSIEDVDEFEPI